MAKDTRELTAEELADVTGGCGSHAENRERVRDAYKDAFESAIDSGTPFFQAVQSGRAHAAAEIADIRTEYFADDHGKDDAKQPAGQPAGQYDLNKDGKVNEGDVALALSRTATPPVATPTVAATPAVPATPAPATPAPATPAPATPAVPATPTART